MSKYSFITVSNRLPVSVTKSNGRLSFVSSGGGLATAMSSLEGSEARLWIGWPGIASEQLTTEDRRAITHELRKQGCAPVFLTQKQVEGFYEGYANGTIWALFHYFQHHAVFNDEHWREYEQVNALFQKAVLRYAADDATVWVHDYHLMLLPELLRKELPRATLGFFLHIPFPSYEVFRLLPNGAQVLRGLLGADLVGFHTYDYTTNFTNSVRRALGYESENGSVIMGHRIVRTDAFPIGIDYDKFANSVGTPEVEAEIAALKTHYRGQRLIISVDRLDYTKGIAERLEAFGRFLEEHPAYHKKVTLVVIAVPSRTEVDAYRHMRDTIELTVSRINGTYATMNWSPISYQFTNLPFEQLAALYAVAEVALVTPLRDGMNLVAKEFLACKQQRPGVLILSETTGAASELPEALHVNPYDRAGMVAALKRALKTPLVEQKLAVSTMQARISQYSVARWSSDFMEQLARAKTETTAYQRLRLEASTWEHILSRYSATEKRLFLLDYDGTLRDYVFSPSIIRGRPSTRLLVALSKLTADPHNRVCIVSGRTRDALEAWFGNLPVILAAEHGAWLREHGHWAQADLDFREHKEIVRPILARYAERTPGAMIEEKHSAMVWHYRNVIHDLAYLRNNSLRHELTTALSDSNTGIYDGHKIIEIKPRSLNKGLLVSELLAGYPADFILAAGDDYTDEDMFEALPGSALTLKVGIGPTKAKYRIGSSDDVVELLEALGELG
jgi:trehalose 6-phosphate synthase/phosphatase